MEKKLEDLSQIEIKSIIYDQIVLLERTKGNIDVLQKRLQELAEKEQSEENKQEIE